MKKVIATSVMALALGATAASAEVKVGLGYTIADGIFNQYVSQPANIRVPIDFDFGLRIEPEIGLGTETTTNNGPFNVDETTTYRTLAVGGYYTIWKVEKVNFYAGGRLGLTQVEAENWNGTGGVDTVKTDYTSLQALFGAEYMFTEDFSFGAQAGLEYVSGSGGTSDSDSMGTVTHLLIHYFF